MCGSGSTTTHYGTTPEQDRASKWLMAMATGRYDKDTLTGGEPWAGFNIDKSIVTDILGQLESGEFAEQYGLGSFLESALAGGQDVDISDFVEKERLASRRSEDIAANRQLRKASAAGARWGTSAARAAGGAAADVAGQTDAKIAQQMIVAQQANQQFKMGIAQTSAALLDKILSGQMQLAQFTAAIDQWEQGMNYEEWKRNNPTIFELLTTVWGRNVDTAISEDPGSLGPILQVVGGIVGAMIMRS